MKNNQTIFRGKTHLWIILIFCGIYAYMIFAYIHQRDNNPAADTVLIIFAIIWISISALLLANRFITVDDEFVKFKFYLSSVKIHILQIKDVSVDKMSFFRALAKYSIKYSIEFRDFTGHVLIIQTKTGKVYRFAIKNAQKIKEEIEKRMLTNNITSL